MEYEQRFKIGNKISQNTIIGNIILTIIKLTIGTVGRSHAMFADGLHSLSDILSTVAVIIGLKLSNKKADEHHPYGHEKIEPIVAKLLATILFVTAISIGFNAINNMIKGYFSTPLFITIYAAVLSIIGKEWMYQYTVKGAKKINSTALLADAWHHRSDAFSSIGALIGIIGAMMGYPILDGIASIVICLFVGKVAFDIYWQAIKQLIDHAGDADTVRRIREDILRTEGVISIDQLKTRIHADKLYVDVDVSVDGNLSLVCAHSIAEKVHQTIECNQENVKHCMVHVNPYSKNG